MMRFNLDSVGAVNAATLFNGDSGGLWKVSKENIDCCFMV